MNQAMNKETTMTVTIRDILGRPEVRAAREEVQRLYQILQAEGHTAGEALRDKAGAHRRVESAGEAYDAARNSYHQLVNSMCAEAGLPPHIREGKDAHYTIDVLFVRPDGRLVQEWDYTGTALAEAQAAYLEYAQRRDVAAAALCSWEPGSEGGRLVHGSQSSRNCTGGVPTARLLKHGHRTVITHGGRPLTLLDWEDSDGQGREMSTQPSPGFRLSSRMYSEEAMRFASHPWAEAPGHYVVSWTEFDSCGNVNLCHKSVPASDLPEYQERAGYSAREKVYSADQAAMCRLMIAAGCTIPRMSYGSQEAAEEAAAPGA